MNDQEHDLLSLAASVVAAYVANNRVQSTDLAGLIASTHAALGALGAEPPPPVAAPLVPAVSIKKSVTPDAIICLEDGKPFKSLKRHLRSSFNMTPEEYRTKWGLPVDYPMVAPNYAEARSEMAKRIGLGRKVVDGKPGKARGRPKR